MSKLLYYMKTIPLSDIVKAVSVVMYDIFSFFANAYRIDFLRSNSLHLELELINETE